MVIEVYPLHLQFHLMPLAVQGDALILHLQLGSMLSAASHAAIEYRYRDIQ